MVAAVLGELSGFIFGVRVKITQLCIRLVITKRRSCIS